MLKGSLIPYLELEDQALLNSILEGTVDWETVLQYVSSENFRYRPYRNTECMQLINDKDDIRDFMCPFDTHYPYYKQSVPTVSTAVSYYTKKCKAKMILEQSVPLYLDPLDLFYIERGNVFHKYLYDKLRAKEIPLFSKEIGISGRADGLYVTSDGKVVLTEFKTTSLMEWSIEKYLPRKDHVLQVSFYAYLLRENYDIVPDYFELYYNSFDSFFKVRLINDIDYDDIERKLVEFVEWYNNNIAGKKYEFDPTSLAFDIPESDKRREAWECCYCPFWLVCPYGRATVTYKSTKTTETCSVYESWRSGRYKTYYTVAGYEVPGSQGVTIVHDYDIDEKFTQTAWSRFKVLAYLRELPSVATQYQLKLIREREKAYQEYLEKKKQEEAEKKGEVEAKVKSVSKSGKVQVGVKKPSVTEEVERSNFLPRFIKKPFRPGS